MSEKEKYGTSFTIKRMIKEIEIQTNNLGEAWLKAIEQFRTSLNLGHNLDIGIDIKLLHIRYNFQERCITSATFRIELLDT